jgi:hypothetical protein
MPDCASLLNESASSVARGRRLILFETAHLDASEVKFVLSERLIAKSQNERLAQPASSMWDSFDGSNADQTLTLQQSILQGGIRSRQAKTRRRRH